MYFYYGTKAPLGPRPPHC